jgi:hypothetical protein
MSHGAAPSAAGYQYQTWWGLLEMLRRGLFDHPDATLTLEMHDDIAWDENGSPTELLQLKHHQGTARTLSDSSDDVWRSLLVWMETASPSDPAGPLLYLVSTAVAPIGSAAHALRADSRDEPAALERLIKAAAASRSTATQSARSRFLALGVSAQSVFVSRIFVVDGAQHLEDVDAEARRSLGWALPRDHEDLFMHMLWGWWDEQAIGILRRHRGGISAPEVHQKVSEMRDQFTLDRLPTLVEMRDANPAELFDTYSSLPFVAQLQWISWPPVNLQKAIIDYYRAYTQTTQWVSEDLIGLDELQRFEDELVDEWEREFEFMRIDLGSNADDDDDDDDEKQRAGSLLLRRLLDATAVRVRARYDEPFFARGKRHEIADSGRIGWHADFEARLKALLLTI